jgi:DNA-binding transcriptional LysR family regulator
MELRHLRYFHAVASELSFSRAAQRLHMAQPPLSRQIRQLEEELGAELIDRGAKPLQLTPAGRFFFEQSAQLLDRVKEVCEATRRIADGKREWFGIGFVPSMLYGMLPDLIRRFRTAAQGVEVGLLELTSTQQVEALKAGRIDVGFSRMVLEDRDISYELIFEEPLVAALPARHRLLSAQRVSLRKLAAEPLILYPARPRPSHADQVLQLFRSRGLVPTTAMEANELQTAIGLVAAGVGVTLVPASVHRLHRDDVAYRPLTDAGVVSPVLINFRTEDRSALLARFRALVRRALKQP